MGRKKLFQEIIFKLNELLYIKKASSTVIGTMGRLFIIIYGLNLAACTLTDVIVPR